LEWFCIFKIPLSDFFFPFPAAGSVRHLCQEHFRKIPRNWFKSILLPSEKQAFFCFHPNSPWLFPCFPWLRRLLAQEPHPLQRVLFNLFPQCPELFFVPAEIFGTVAAVQVLVGFFRKTLWMPVESDLPPDQKKDGKQQQAPCVSSPDKEQGCKHHGIVPVIDSAGAAALILQKPALERTEEKDTDHIADRISAAEKKHDPIIQNFSHSERTDPAVQNNPDQGNQNRCVIVLNHNIRLAGFDVVPGKLFLASGAFNRGREKPKQHFKGKDQPGDFQDQRAALQSRRYFGPSMDPEQDVTDQQGSKQQGPICQPDKMKGTDNREFLFHCTHPSFFPHAHILTAFPLPRPGFIPAGS
jgi:hypothetical protein